MKDQQGNLTMGTRCTNKLQYSVQNGGTASFNGSRAPMWTRSACIKKYRETFKNSPAIEKAQTLLGNSKKIAKADAD